jgi:hypothetical protein
MDEYLARPLGGRLDRLRSTPELFLGDWVASLAGHDDNHLAQLRRTLDDRP